MANSNETTLKFKCDISDLKKNISEAQRQVKLANAEFKAATAGMGDWSKSADGLSAKIKQLQTTLDAQKKILTDYEKQLELIEKEYGTNSKEADQMRIKVLEQEAAVKKTESALKGFEDQLKDVEKEEKEAAEAAEKQAGAYDKLQKEVDDQQKELDQLKDAYKQVVIEQGKDSEAAKDLAKQIDDLSGELKDNKEAMEKADKAADELDKSLDDVDPKKTADGFTVLKGALADLAANAITAVISGLKDMARAAADAWKEFDEGRDTVIKLTGATGDMADALTKSYGNVSRSVLADSEDIGKAVGEVSTRFGLQGKDLENLATEYIKFSKITEADLIGSIDNTQKALSAYGKDAGDAEAFLNALTKTSQDTGVSTDTLTSGIISNATAFQEMGLSLEQAVAFMGQLETSGTNSETVLNGMRKALKNSSKDGMSLNQSLLTLQKQIENGTNDMDGLNAAYALFGKSGDQIYGAIKNGTLSFKNLTAAVGDAEGALDNTYAATMDATDSIKLELQNLKVTAAEAIDDFLKENGDTIAQLIQDIAAAFSFFVEHGDAIIATLVGIGTAFAAWQLASIISSLYAMGAAEAVAAAKTWLLNSALLANPIGLVIAAIAALVAAFVYLWNHSEKFREFWRLLWEGIKQAVETAVQKIKEVWENLKESFSNAWDNVKNGASIAWEFIKNVWATVSEWFNTTVVEPVKNFFSNMWEGLKTGASQAWEGVKSAFSPVAEWFRTTFQKAWENVKKVFSAGGAVFQGIQTGILNAFKAVVNGIIRGINRVIAVPFNAINKTLERIRNVTIAGVKPFAGVVSRFSVPQIPLLAQGGVLEKGQVGLLEGNGAEAVVPLENNKKWINAVAQSLKKSLASEGIINSSGGGSTIGGTTNYNFVQNNTSPKALSRLEIYRQTQNQLNFARGV